MHSFEVHSNESACRKSGSIGLEQVMYMWTLSRYFRRFLSGFFFGGLGIVAKDLIVEGRIPELTRLELV